ncbi:hypothetical protein LSAT2_026379 [Lamellibrachia satsuma]|nr:hypothetical protein LSAT2_026379 [Lamellibrachia satsuma]
MKSSKKTQRLSSITELVKSTIDPTSSRPSLIRPHEPPPRPPLKHQASVGGFTPAPQVHHANKFNRTQSESQCTSQENIMATLRSLLQQAGLVDGAPKHEDDSWAVTESILNHYLTQDTRHLADYLSLVRLLPDLLVRFVMLINTRLEIRRDADPYSSYTPLGYAIISHDADLVKTLLNYAADPDVVPCIPVDEDAMDILSPVHLALRQHCKTEIVNALLGSGERKPQVNEDYMRSIMSYVARCSDTDCVKALLDQMKNLNRTDENGRTMLHRAAFHINAVVVKHLVARKADVNKADKSLKTPLMCAAEVNAGDIVKFLVDHGADVNMTEVFGRSPLHFAVRKSTIAAVRCLLAAGADATTKDKRDLTPLHYAYVDSKILERKHPKEEDVGLLMQCIINSYATGQAYCTDQDFLSIAEILIKMSETSDTIIKLMTDNVCHISVQNDSGTTALHYAANFNKPKIVRWLIQHGVDVNVANNDGWQAIHYAAMSGNVVSATDILAQNGADINSSTYGGWTPIWIALRNGHKEMADFFIKKGCDVSKTMKVNDLIFIESGYVLPLELYDPEQNKKDPVKFAKRARRSITLADFATSVGFHETARQLSKT